MRQRKKPKKVIAKNATAAASPTALTNPALWKRAAAELKVSVSDLERATVLGQVAGLLIAHRAIGRRLAFKGGAIMHLVDGSPRLSGDLDGVVTTSGTVTLAMIGQRSARPRVAASSFGSVTS